MTKDYALGYAEGLVNATDWIETTLKYHGEASKSKLILELGKLIAMLNSRSVDYKKQGEAKQ